jgi:hypothetical protein
MMLTAWGKWSFQAVCGMWYVKNLELVSNSTFGYLSFPWENKGFGTEWLAKFILQSKNHILV